MASNNLIGTHAHESQWRNQLMKSMQDSSENPQSREVNVGQRLQELRQLHGLSLRALAEMSGLNVNTLSLIENDKSSPNVSTLQQLASALNVPVTVFFETSTSLKSVVFQKSGERPTTAFPQGIFEDLGGGLALGEATPLLMILKPNEVSDPDSFVHTGQEFVYCLEGNIKFWVGDESYVLEPGDSLIFEAHIPHRWENLSNSISRSILIICPSDREDRSVIQHLETNLSTERF